MKLVIAIIQKDDAGRVMDALLKQEFRATRIDSSGGFLRKTNATLLIGVEEADVDEVIAAVRSTTKPRTDAAEGSSKKVDLGAVLFVVDLDGAVRL